MNYKYVYWPRVKEHLSTSDVSGSDLLDLNLLCGDLSPLPVEVSKIPLGTSLVPEQFIEIIVRNLVDQKVALRYSTWKEIRGLYETVEIAPSSANQKLLEILLVASKVNAAEYFEAYYKFEVPIFPNATVSSFYDHWLSRRTLQALNLMVNNDSIGVHPVREDLSFAIKAFLHLPAIVEALQASLMKGNLDKDVKWIRSVIGAMNIMHVENGLFIGFNGFTVRNGILLIADEYQLDMILVDHVVNMPWAKWKAKILTMAIHETCHFLIQVGKGDYNYSPPWKGPTLLYDDAIPGKRLELGRHVELLLFGNVQPNWINSSIQAALDFLNNAKTSPTYPLISQQPSDPAYLSPRIIPSISMAADLEDFEIESIN